jgi:hypothetical protein
MRDTGGQATDAGQFLAAHELALRVEQPVGHVVQALGEPGEIARIGIGGAGREVTAGDGIGGFHHPVEGPEHQPLHQAAAVEHEDPDLEGDEHDHQDDAAFGGDRQGELGGRHPHEDREGGEEGEVEEQLRAERGFGLHGATICTSPIHTPKKSGGVSPAALVHQA